MDIGQCELCKFEPVELEEEFDKSGKKIMICGLCTSVVTSTPNKDLEVSAATLKTMCYVGNSILFELQKLIKEKEAEEDEWEENSPSSK